MKKRTHGGNIQEAIQKYKLPKNKIIDFSANIIPLKLTKEIKELTLKTLKSISLYPDPKCREFTTTAASLYNISPDNILAGNGSTELIHLIPLALKIKKALIFTPCFSEYEFALKNIQAKPIFIPTKEQNLFQIDLNKIKRYIDKIDLIFLANPNNPTGTFIDPDKILFLAKLCAKSSKILALDEAFVDFVPNLDPKIMAQKSAQMPNFLIIRSLTKFFGLAGLRLGYIIAHKKLIKKISQSQYPWSVNIFAQNIGTKIIQDQEYIKETKLFILKQKKVLLEKLKKIKLLTVYPSAANFILCKLKMPSLSVDLLAKKLGQQGIIIRQCKDFRGLKEGFFRIAVRNQRENQILVSKLKDLLKTI
jgi:threonine-phosphate decarboxylase